MTPGPTNVPADVVEALRHVDQSHRDGFSIDELARVRETTVALLGGDAGFSCIPLAASGTGANEALVHAVEGRLLVLEAGRYSSRLTEIAARCGVATESLSFDTWSGIDPARVDALLAARPDITDVFVVHLETTTGALAPLRRLGEVVHGHGKRLLVDAVSSAFAHPLALREDHVTACTITPNKCLESVPGLSMVVADRAWLSSLRGRARSLYFDLHEHDRQLSAQGAPAFTLSPALLAATRVALGRALSEGVERRGLRYRGLRDQLRDRLREARFGLRHATSDSFIITAFELPASLDPPSLVRGMAEVGFVVQSHRDLTDVGLFAVATLGDLQPEDVTRFAIELERLSGRRGRA